MFPKQRLEEGFSQRDQDSRVMEEPAVRNWGSPCGRDYYKDVKVASEDQQGWHASGPKTSPEATAVQTWSVLGS